MTQLESNEAHTDAPRADSDGVELAPVVIDGLCFIGTVIAVEQVKNKAGQFVDGLVNITVQGSRSTERITAARRERTLNGDVPLPAFEKLIYGQGKQWCISVGGVPYVAANGRAYTNFTAIDAVEL